jgi:hypothetical protein
MLHWSPSHSITENWTPTGGWNNGFSSSEKIKCTNLFFFFKNKKGFKENMAETMAQMVIYKQKYDGMKYSEEQEEILQDALRPVFNS